MRDFCDLCRKPPPLPTTAPRGQPGGPWRRRRPQEVPADDRRLVPALLRARPPLQQVL